MVSSRRSAWCPFGSGGPAWTQFGRGRESERLDRGCHSLDGAEAAFVQPAEDLVDEDLRYGRTRRQADRGHPIEPGRIDVGGGVDQMRGVRTRGEGDLDEAARVRGVG